ncbi:hypothetical protein ICJ57_07450 [Geoglobus acetivorans]|nr:hypothetical protein [Geoglobus acetivorans]
MKLKERKKEEFEAVNLFKSGDFDAIVSDDRKFLKQLGRMGIPFSHHLH